MDKVLHFIVSASMQVVFAALLALLGFEAVPCVLWGGVLAALVGAAKEWGDPLWGGFRDPKDMLANLAGITVAIIVELVLLP